MPSNELRSRFLEWIFVLVRVKGPWICDGCEFRWMERLGGR